jgi:alpha-tubulin suppressor-like RCC1 family protein
MRFRSVLSGAVALSALGLAACGNDTPTAPQAGPALATTAAALWFRQTSAGWDHTCAVTGDRIYCWGGNSEGQLGDGTKANRLRPVQVTGGYRWREVTAGFQSTCGITVDNRAYCWGIGWLGDGSEFRTQIRPVAVAGGLSFRHISNNPHSDHTCGITTDDRAYCWGLNQVGQLGTGTIDPSASLSPVAVTGGRRFRQVSVGPNHTCAVNPYGVIWCWGFNMNGELGAGTTTPSGCSVDAWDCVSRVPVRVQGNGLVFRQVSAGGAEGGYTCGVTTDNRAYCWGFNRYGTLGDGSVTQRLTPAPVVGRHSFRRVEAGSIHTCGVTTDDRAFCWGRNYHQILGDGTTNYRWTRPSAVIGGLQFNRINVGRSYTCALTPANRAYCWGENPVGQLGDGTTTNRVKPTAVVGPT